MKKKRFLFILILLIVFVCIPVYADDTASSVTCQSMLGNLLFEIKQVYGYVRIVVPVLLILLTSLDFAKVVLSDSKDGMDKAKNNFLKRAVAALIIFFAPNILTLIAYIIDGPSEIVACLDELENAQYQEESRPQLGQRDRGTSTTPPNETVQQITSITFNSGRNSIELQVGNTYDITAYVNSNAYNKTVSWSVDNPGIASIRDVGNNTITVTATNVGTAIISATAVNGVSSQFTVKVSNEGQMVNGREVLRVTEMHSEKQGNSGYKFTVTAAEEYDMVYLCVGSCEEITPSVAAEEIGAGWNRYIKPDKNKVYYYRWNHFQNGEAFYISMSQDDRICYAIYSSATGKMSGQFCPDLIENK